MEDLRNSAPEESSSLPDFGIDTNGDGKVDTVFSDTTGDGKMDTVSIDLDGDGTPDTILMDLDGDGLVDAEIHYTPSSYADSEELPPETPEMESAFANVSVIDLDGDGTGDILCFDTDENGDTDTVAIDLDGDGLTDVLSIDLDGDGIADITLTMDGEDEEETGED